MGTESETEVQRMAVLGETRSWSPKPWEFRRYNCDFHPKSEVNKLPCADTFIFFEMHTVRDNAVLIFRLDYETEIHLCLYLLSR